MHHAAIDTRLLEQVNRIAVRAGALALQRRDDGLKVSTKADGTPLTDADQAAHELICRELRSLLSDTPILSEENVDFPGPDIRSGWQRCWMVDPIDGTREFMRGSPDFTVNIALLQGSRPILGVIRAPEHGTDYLAIHGRGCWRRLADHSLEPIRTRTTNRNRLCIISGRRRHNRPQLDTLLNALGVTVCLEQLGSSLKACRVAEGAVDLCVQFSSTSEWDSAAAQCIVEEAGGLLTDTSLEPLRYNRRATLDNPEFVVIADPNFPWQQYLPPSPRTD